MNLVKSLEFQEIINRIIHYCRTSGAKEEAQNIKFSNDFNHITALLRQSYQMRGLLMGMKQFPDSGYIDMREVLSQLKVKDSRIALEDMPKLYDSLTCVKDILTFLKGGDTAQIPDLIALVQSFDNSFLQDDESEDLGQPSDLGMLHTVYEILHNITEIIDEEGNIKPSCSPVLREIYNKKESKRRQIEKQINQIILHCKKEGYTNDEDEISVRNDALVVPVKATYKRNVKGILHDTSQTGQTFYIEPEEIVSLNFEMKELFFEEQREIHRILLEFSDLLRSSLQTLINCYGVLVQIDFIRAKAMYALETNASMPQMTDKPACLWYDARHPILESALKQKGKSIVPLKIELNEKQRILVISGPNAGGKSVCLKTVALLQYMLQCGLLVPMKEVSVAGIFEKIFLSIGDQQSLSDDLSTYSSHLKNLSQICEQSDRDTLFLIDELGTGTDPAAGGAIAESILEHLNTIKAYGVVTTHYSVLKHLAFDHAGIVNAAMLFDTSAMKPLYTLTIGTPGSSFAFEIAEKIGLSKVIIANAKKKLGKQGVKFEEKLQQIEVNKLESEKHLRSAKQYDEILYQTVQKYREMSLKLENDKKQILNQARNQAKEILSSANRQIEHTIEQIKTTKAEKETVKQLKKEVKTQIETLTKDIQKEETPQTEADLPTLKKQNIKIIGGEILLNDYVIFPQTENIGEVVGIDKNRLQIDMGDMRIQTTKKNVVKIDKHSYLKQMQDNSRNNASAFNNVQIKTSFDLNKIRQDFNEKLDLRGYRGEEALTALEKFLDDARMLGERHLKILHGKGDGILKTLVRDYLRRQADVVSCHAEDIRFGGEGITVVELE